MAYPTQRQVEIPLLKVLDEAGGEAQARDVYGPVARHFPELTDQEQTAYLENGRIKKWPNLVQWVRQRLIEAGELDSPGHGVWRITPKGRARLSGVTAPRTAAPPRARSVEAEAGVDVETATTETPQALIERAHRQIRDVLAKELLDAIAGCSPAFFERLVVELLVRMGYGGTLKDAGAAIGQSGDGGIDGVIKEDRLGLDVVYVQAKRWAPGTVVGRPEIQRFAGALQPHHARKGVFITTSTFTKDARQYAEVIDTKIILIDGRTLAELMIEFDLGVAHVATYPIKRVDSDYFTEE